MLIFSRGVIALFNAISLTMVSNSLKSTAAIYYILLTITQFHTMFWGSRSIPNTFATIIFQCALSYWISDVSSNSLINNSHCHKMITLLIFAIVVFRAELAPISGMMVLIDIFIRKKYSFIRAFCVAVIAAVLFISLTIVIDSYYWQQKFLWPELQVFKFNG